MRGWFLASCFLLLSLTVLGFAFGEQATEDD